MLQKYVEREGAEKLTVLKEHLLKENHYKEIKMQKEQEVLFRKLENIYQTSVYKNLSVQTNIQEQNLIFPQVLEEKTAVEKTLKELHTKETAVKERALKQTVVKESDVKEIPVFSQTEVLKNWTHTLAEREIYRETQKILEKQFVKVENSVLQKEYSKMLSGETVHNFWNNQRTENISQMIQAGTNMLVNNVLQKSWQVQPITNNNEIAHVHYQNTQPELHYYEEHVQNHAENELVHNQQMIQNQQILHNQQEIQNQQILHNQQMIQNQQNVQNQQLLQNQQNVQNLHEEKNVQEVHQFTPQQFVQNVLNEQTKQLQQVVQQRNVSELSNVRYQNVNQELNYYEGDSVQNLEEQHVVQNQQNIQNQQLLQNQQNIQKFETELLNQHHKTEQLAQNVLNQQTEELKQELWNVETLQKNQQILQNQQNVQNIQNQQSIHQKNISESASELSNVHYQNISQELNYYEGDTVWNQENHQNIQNSQNIQNHQNIQNSQNIQSQQIIQNQQNVQNDQKQEIWNVETLQKKYSHVNPTENLTELSNVHYQNSKSELNYYEGDSVQNQEHQEILLQQKNQLTQELRKEQQIHHQQIQQNVQNQQRIANQQSIQTQQLIQTQQNIQNQQLVQNQQNIQNQQLVQNLQKQQNVQSQQIQQNLQHVTLEHLSQNVLNEQTKQLQQEVWNVETLHKHQKVQLQQLENNNETILQKAEAGNEVSNVLYQNISPQLNYYEGDVVLNQGQQTRQELIQQNQIQQNLIHQEQMKNYSQSQMLNQLVKKDHHLNLQTFQHIKNAQLILNNYPLFKNENVQNEFITKKLQTIQKRTEFVQGMEPAPIIYNEGTDKEPAKKEQIAQLQKRVDEVVRDLKTVEEKSIVRKKEVTAQQREIVKEVLTTNSTVWTEGSGQEMIRREVQCSLEQGMPENIDRIATKVYRRLEEKLKMERGRRGMN